MNDTKPTAKAAKTVVSTEWDVAEAAASIGGGRRSEVVAREIFLEALGVLRAERAGAVAVGRRGGVQRVGAGAAQAREQDGEQGEDGDGEGERDEVGGQAEAAGVRG